MLTFAAAGSGHLRGRVSRLRTVLGGHLGDGLAMSLAAGGASLVGMISWIVAARALTPAELGTATAFVSGFLLIAGCTDLNLGIGLLRWLPGAGSSSRLLLARAGLTVALLAGVVSVVYLLLPEASVIVDAAANGSTVPSDRLLGAAMFVLASVLWATFQQQDFVLVGLERSWWAPARTAVFAVGRLGILVAAGTSLTTSGVVVSWLVPTAACVALVGAQVLVFSRHRGRRAGFLPPRRDVVGFLGPTYVGKVATSVLFNQVPLLITFRFGPEAGAGFFLVWQAVTVVDVVAQYFVASLSAAVAREPGRADELSRAVRRRLLLALTPMLAVGALLAGPVLSLFGTRYEADAPVLQIMMVGLVLRLLVVHRLGEHQALGRGVRYARLAGVNTVLVLAVAAVVPVLPAIAGADGALVAVAAGFLVVQALCAGAVTWRRRDVGSAAVVGGPPRGEGAP